MGFKIEVSENTGGGENIGPRPLPKKGSRPARLVKVYELGLHEHIFKGESQGLRNQIVLEFDLVNDLAEFDDEDKPIRIDTGWYFPLTFSANGTVNKKANLFKYVQALDPDLVKESFMDLIGEACMVTVDHYENKSGDMRAKLVHTPSSPPDIDGFIIPEMVGVPYYFDFNDHDAEELAALPDFIQEKIKSADNFE